MHCSDLERVLEACLDGRLGRSRLAVLRQHLVVCRSCRQRVERLRHFEAELHRRFRSMRHEPTLWAALDLQAVGDVGELGLLPFRPARPQPARLAIVPPVSGRHLRRSLQAPSARARRPWHTMLGAVLILAALGTIAQLAWRIASGPDGETQRYRAYLDGGQPPEFATAAPIELEAWMASKLGRSVRLPTAPAGAALVGGTIEMDGAESVAAVVYAFEGESALLLIEPTSVGGENDAGLDELTAEGLNYRAWKSGGHDYSLVSALPPDKLALFARP